MKCQKLPESDSFTYKLKITFYLFPPLWYHFLFKQEGIRCHGIHRRIYSKTSCKSASSFSAGRWHVQMYPMGPSLTCPHPPVSTNKRPSLPSCETAFTLWSPPSAARNAVSKQRFESVHYCSQQNAPPRPTGGLGAAAVLWKPLVHLCGAASPTGCSKPMTERRKGTT